MTDCAATCVAEAERLCGECWDRLAVRLREVPGLVDELEVTITRQDKIAAARVGGKGTETPLPFNAPASLAKAELRHFLGSWARDVADRSGASLPAGVDRDVLSDAARWLLEHEGAVRHHPAADDLCEEIANAVWGAVRAIDLPEDRVFAGWCCVALYARPNAATVVCRECQTEHEVDEARLAMLGRLLDHRARASDAERVLALAGVRVPASTIRWWFQEGKLPRTAAKRYRIGDLVELAARSVA